MDEDDTDLTRTNTENTRLAQLENEFAARRLIDRYAHACDTNDPPGVAALFDGGGVLLVDATTFAGDEILAFYRKRLHAGSLHFTTGLTVSARPDGFFDATCGFLAVTFDGTKHRVSIGRYTDVLRIADGTATFVSRQIDLQRRLEQAEPLEEVRKSSG